MYNFTTNVQIVISNTQPNLGRLSDAEQLL